jgi:transposase
MDNMPCHKSEEIRELIEVIDAEAWWLTPYNPDFNPIEKMWLYINNIYAQV